MCAPICTWPSSRATAAGSRSAAVAGRALLRRRDPGAGPAGARGAWRQACRVAIHDEGALPFVIAARIETAARRAGLGAGTQGVCRRKLRCPSRRRAIACAGRGSIFPARAEVLHQCRPARARRHHSRSGRFGSSRGKGCRADSGAQHAARGGFRQCERMVRINQLPLGLEDLAEIVPEVARPDPDSEGRSARSRSRKSTA